MHVLTWNIHRSAEAFRLACLHLASAGERYVMCLQEPPGESNLIGLMPESTRTKIDLRMGVADRILFLSTRDVRWHDEPAVFIPRGSREATERMVGAEIVVPGFDRIQIIGVHFPDRRTVPEDVTRHRENVIRDLAIEIRCFWQDGPLVVLGDFNANPFHMEIAGARYLWAVRDRSNLDRQRPPLRSRFNPLTPVIRDGKRFENLSAVEDALPGQLKPQRPLYNPMWRWLGEQEAHPKGTYRYDGDDAILEWNCLDQVLVSADFADRIDVRIMTRLHGESLIARDHKTPKAQFSDHLPVEAQIKENHS